MCPILASVYKLSIAKLTRRIPFRIFFCDSVVLEWFFYHTRTNRLIHESNTTEWRGKNWSGRGDLWKYLLLFFLTTALPYCTHGRQYESLGCSEVQQPLWLLFNLARIVYTIDTYWRSWAACTTNPAKFNYPFFSCTVLKWPSHASKLCYWWDGSIVARINSILGTHCKGVVHKKGNTILPGRP